MLHALIQASDLYHATLYRTDDAPYLIAGCWAGTLDEFRTMVESDTWVEATPEQIERHRPELLAFAAMCEARVATWG